VYCFDFISSGCKDSITRIAREVIEDKFNDGVRYIELRFSPHLLANCDVTPNGYIEDLEICIEHIMVEHRLLLNKLHNICCLRKEELVPYQTEQFTCCWDFLQIYRH